MSSIRTAAYESLQTNRGVRLTGGPFAWKRYSLLLLGFSLSGIAAVVGGSYLHIFWNLRNPPPPPVINVVQPDTFISDVHYVYTTKALPVTQGEVSDLKNALFATSPLLKQFSTPPENELPAFQESSLMTPPDGSTDEISAKLREKLAMALRDQSREFNSEVPPGAMDEPVQTASRAAEESDNDAPDAMRQRLPYLKYQSHMYSSDGSKSRVKLNNHLYKEGDNLAQNVVISKITTDQLIVKIDGKPYSLPSLKDWKP
ncbi:general secretion pathway protein GspB [Atlantibacter sp.]|uniref:general secretion pathway protein GspB n=1 Tax=Atlantibacter sp. TaxID=1903473 RepID=UPI0028A7C91A|nr:general secretion pathway protein GspB [Atlantibacter sp.]